jgi:hypothetical protein
MHDSYSCEVIAAYYIFAQLVLLFLAPAYRPDHPLSLQLNSVLVTVNWMSTFYINGKVIEFTLFVNSTATYVGPATSYSFTLPAKLQGKRSPIRNPA